MKLANWASSIVRAIVIALVPGLPVAGGLPEPGVLFLDRADILVEAAGEVPRLLTTRALPHRWDKDGQGKDGRITYSMTLPSTPSTDAAALFIPRVGNQVEVHVGGALVYRHGTLGDASTDSAKAPVWIELPRPLLDASRPTSLEIHTTTQVGRWGGLSTIQFGPSNVLRPIYATNYAWRQFATVVIVISLGLMGLMASGLWWQQRDPTYGLLALTALFGVIRMSDRIWVHPPMPWPYWGAFTAAAFWIHLLLMARFAMIGAGLDTRWMRTGFWVSLLLGIAAATWSFLLCEPVVWTVALATMLLPGAVVMTAVLQRAIRTHERNAILLCIAGTIVIVAGCRDFLVVRFSPHGADSFSVLPHAVFVFVLFMGWIVVNRYSQQVRQYRQLNATLEQRILEREQQLHVIHAQLQERAQVQATWEERQRIMRDIHDGVGAHLVSLVGLVRRGGSSSHQLHAGLNSALDELRVAVDSLQPVHGDLATVLATLRYRLQPRLQAAGLEVGWDVQPLAPMDGLQPQMVLQIQRLLLEAFTNVLRHSHATRVDVTAVSHHDRITVAVKDNGIGFELSAQQRKGVGLESMRARATAVGAELNIQSRPGDGTVVQIELHTRAQCRPGGDSAGRPAPP